MKKGNNYSRPGRINILVYSSSNGDITKVNVGGFFIKIAGIECFKHYNKCDDFNIKNGGKCIITHVDTGAEIASGTSYAQAIKLAKQRLGNKETAAKRINQATNFLNVKNIINPNKQ